MLFFAVLIITIRYYSGVVILDNGEELAVDPLSLFVDPNLYQFCWIQIGQLKDFTIHGWNKKLKSKVTFNAFQDKHYDKKTYCIELRNRADSFIISLPMTKLTTTPKIMNFTIRFYQPLGPSLELLQYRTVPKGIYLELKTEFAGISSSVGPLCHVLVMSEKFGNKIFEFLKIDIYKKPLISIPSGSNFSIYYTCTLLEFFDSSTRFVLKKGVFLHSYQNTGDLYPLLQMPLRRFLKVIWKPKETSLSKRYDIAIYMNIRNQRDKCIKIFRIFVNIFPNVTLTPRTYAPNCTGNIDMEDMLYFGGAGDGSISIILDMVRPLLIYREYKFIIFWQKSSKNIGNNFVHFTPLPNENSGNINNKFFEYQSTKYDDLINEISTMDQTAISHNNQNPYKSSRLNISGYSNFAVYGGVMSESETSLPFKDNLNVSKVYNDCKESVCSKNIYPYFYVIYFMKTSSGTYTEIVQLPIPQDNRFGIEELQFIPINEDLRFMVSWKIPGYPHSIMPALFGIEITYGDNKTCHSAYVLKCQTCNKIYVQDAMKNGDDKINYWHTACSYLKITEGQYDAVDSSILFKTEKMPPDTKFKTQIFTFKENIIIESVNSFQSSIKESFWQKYGKITIIGICTGICICLLILLFLYFKKPSKEPVRKKISHDEELPEEIYDEDPL